MATSVVNRAGIPPAAIVDAVQLLRNDESLRASHSAAVGPRHRRRVLLTAMEPIAAAHGLDAADLCRGVAEVLSAG